MGRRKGQECWRDHLLPPPLSADSPSVMPRKAMPVCVSWLFHNTRVVSPFLCSWARTQM